MGAAARFAGAFFATAFFAVAIVVSSVRNALIIAQPLK
jgi:hypothetical protein